YTLCIPQFSLYATFYFFTSTAPSEIYTLSLHDALPISLVTYGIVLTVVPKVWTPFGARFTLPKIGWAGVFGIAIAFDLTAADLRSEEHTSELQSRENLVCRLLLEKKKNKQIISTHH